MDLFRTSWGLIWFCDQEAQKSHLWNPIRLQPWQGHDMRHVHPSESLCLPASKALSLHGRAVLLISGIWDYCKLNLPTWELLELQSFPWKCGSDRESELSPVCSRGRIRSEVARAGEDGWMDPRTISGRSGHRGRRLSRGLGFGQEWQPALHISARSPPCLQLQLAGAFAEHTGSWILAFPL